MATPANRRSTMTLYSDPRCPYSHRVRIVLAEKGLTPELVDIDTNNKPEELLALNPYGSVPTLADRDLILYDSKIIMEYLDERFPHPPLMPVYPVARAKTRLMIYRIDKDWYSLLDQIMVGGPQTKQARKELQESIIGIAPLFTNSTYFLSDEFSLLDCVLAPLLWRLPSLDIDVVTKGKSIKKYEDTIFSRPSFQNSLSEAEQELYRG